jgi:flagellar hook assembly protein FlgD
VAGRRVRDVGAAPGSLQIGFNRLYWDGRDEQGDELANGYYLYKVELKGEGKSTTAIGKLVKMR